MTEVLEPLVGFAGVLLLIAAIGWVVSPGFRATVKHKLGRGVMLGALILVGIGIFTYYSQNPR